MLKWNPQGDYPQINDTAYIDSTALVIGKVDIGKNIFIGPGAVVRADEPGSSIAIKDNCNVQDRVIIHALENTSVVIEESTSLAHGCIIHGPCKIGKRCFVGFGSVVFNAEIGAGVIIKHLSCVEEVIILPDRVIESRKIINNQKDVFGLNNVDKGLKEFARKVVKTNLNLVKGYKNE